MSGFDGPDPNPSSLLNLFAAIGFLDDTKEDHMNKLKPNPN
jgi:hypothetical protein